ncbi:MAG: diadenylate cyclase CdaA [Bacteroidales bacterium]|jgi:uncharacterized protein (TIGR00159 family)|nr:diadenylate cyclase CdaA [Bacteroidales bacterium]
MIDLFIQTFPLRIADYLDIILSIILIYFIYRLLKGSTALNIVIAFLIIYLVWVAVSFFKMRILTEIIGQFISVGAIAIIIIFQPEIRRYFAMLGSKSVSRSRNGRFFFWKMNKSETDKFNSIAIIQAYKHLSQSKTGALIVLLRNNDLETIIQTGEVLDCKINTQLIETIFFKNTPLHDGAVIIKGNFIKAARCILPVSTNYNLPPHLGLRHRSAIGISEQTDAIAIVVSEQTGNISIAKAGRLEEDVTPTRLQEFLNEEFA